MNYGIVFVVVVVIIALLVAIGFGIYYLFRGPKECDPPCGVTEKCENGKCIKRPGCTSNVSCPKGQHCVDGVCTDKCTSSAQCLSDQVCTDGKCVPKVGCVVGADCAPGFHCVEGKCINSCTSNEECPGSQVCLNKVCTLRLCNPLTAYTCDVNESCIPHNGNNYCIGNMSCENKCPGNLKCVDGVCKACQNSAECLNGLEVCSEGRCLGCFAGDKSPVVCPEGKNCSVTGCLTPGEEYPTNLPDGSRCNNNDRCLSGKCHGFCYSGECLASSQCPKGSYCMNNTCQPSLIGSQCYVTETECLREGFCNNEICTKEKSGYGSQCLPNLNSCASGLICRNDQKLKNVYFCEQA